MIIELSGHLDTSKVADVKRNIDAQLETIEANEHLVIDCSELEYISSSGLRMCLSILKKHPDMELTDVSNDVYNVFDTTGFTRILKVHKALRKIDLTGCKLLGEGGNGAVYRLNDEEIVKVCKHRQGDEALVHESEQVREAFLMGVPTVISFDTVDSGNGRKGIVMEALDSESLGTHLMADPSDMDDIIPKYVELFRQADAVENDSPLFTDKKEWLRSLLYLPQRVINDEEAAQLATILDEIPDSNHFVHFDGHAGNVLMSGGSDERTLTLIDLGDAGKGHPVLEIAGWAFIMLEPDYAAGCTAAEHITCMSRDMAREFCRRVLSEMFHTTDAAELDYLLQQASLVGRVKSAFIAQRWANVVDSPAFSTYLRRLVRETLTIIPEVKAAVRFFVEKM